MRISVAGAVLGLSLGIAILFPCQSWAADFSAREVAEQLFRADAKDPLNLSRRDLTRLDLSGLDFKQARLEGADMWGADLTGSDLSNVDLRTARLDRVVIIGARFDGADLTGASFLRPTAFSSLASRPEEAASFAGAQLVEAKLFGRLNRASFRRANLMKATLAPFGRTGFIEHIWRTELMGADLTEANLKGANLTYVLFSFSTLRGANLQGAILRNADLSRADLTGADLTGADLTDADLDGAILTGAKGLDLTLGLAEAHNTEKAIR